MGTGATQQKTVRTPTDKSGEPLDEAAIAENLQALKQNLDETDGQLSEHLTVKLSPEGIILELIDSDDTPLFPIGLSQPTPLLEQLLLVVSESFVAFDNELKIVGHTDSRQYRDGAHYDNWNLSADRANTARRLLSESGISQTRIREVSGKADTDPLIPEDLTAAQNRRISIVILKNKPSA